jgi:hypothetical protein
MIDRIPHREHIHNDLNNAHSNSKGSARKIYQKREELSERN